MALKPLNSVGGFSVGEIPANVILANADITANKATFNGNVLISPANNAAYGILTDNLYYANGTPWDMQQAAGSNGELQFNLNDDFAASANLLWDNANSNLTITGNANITGTLSAGSIAVNEIKNGNSNIAIPTANGNVNISSAGNANIVVVTGTGANVSGTLNVTGNANVGNLGTDTAIITTGNITTINSGLLQNGTTNVTLTQGGNVATYIAGNSTAQFTVTATGVNVAGYANIIGNANIGNIGTGELVATGNISGANLIGPLANGTSNVSIPAVNGNVNTSVGGVANVLVVTTTGANVTGTFNATGNLTAANANLGNLVTANYANFANDLVVQGNIANANNISVTNALAANTGNFSGNVTALNTSAGNLLTANFANISSNLITNNLEVNLQLDGNTANFDGNVAALGILTDNLYHANGSPWDFQQPAGTNTEIQFNDGNGGFGASNAFVFDYVGNVLTVTGNANVTGTLIGNIGNFSGNLTSLNANLGNLVTANYANFANDLVVQGNIANANNISVTNNITSNTANVTGNANVGNLGTATAIITTGNITTINSGLLQNGGTNVTLTNNGNISTFVGGNATAQMVVTGTGVNVAGTANVLGNANVGNLGTNEILTTGNISISNAVPTNGILTDNLYYSNGLPWDLQEAAGNTTEVQFNNNGDFDASANFTWNSGTNLLDINGNIDVSDTAIVQGNVKTPNIQSAGNLTITTDLGVDNNQFVFTDGGNVVMPGNATIVNANGNISIQSGALGKYAELLSGDSNTAIWVEDSPDGAYIGANLTGTPVTWNFKTNGDLVTNPGNITIGANGNIVASTFIGDFEGNVEITVSNTFVLFSDDGQITGASGFTFDKISNLVTMSGNLELGLAGENQIINLSNTALEIRGGWGVDNTTGVNIVAGDYPNASNWGKLAILGNVGGNSVGYSEANAFIFTNPGAGVGNIVKVDPINNTATNTTSGAIVVNGGIGVSNDSFFGGNLSVTGNIANANNISVTNTLTAITGNFSGNITSLNANLGNLADANYIRTGELMNGNSNVVITANGNILFSVTGVANVHKFSNVGVNVVGYVEANGNGTFGALYSNTLTATGGNLTIYAAAGDNYVEIRPTGNGQVDVGNHRITSLAEPVASTDAATKAYVDAAVEGLHIHAPSKAATPDTLANISGGTITYNNGSSGVGATLVTTGTYTLIDGVNIATIGTRILVKNEANTAHNGIYTYTDATTLTRATDYDTPTEMAGGDFTFVTNGTLYNDTGWVQIEPVVTVGTTPVIFYQFSGAGTYTAGPGLTLNGTQFSVNVDNITTEIAGSNVVVKANAQFTTPNIGAATGTSLDLTGNALVNNLNSNLKVTTTDLDATGNIIAANISANANLLVNNATVNLSLTGNTANFSGNVVVPNLTVNLALAGNTANFTGNLIAANITANGIANVGNLNVAGNVTSDLLPNANLTLDVGSSSQRWDNVYAGNLDASGNITISGNTNVTSNVVANNITANTSIDLGNSAIYWAEVTTTNTTPNQTISTVTIAGVTGVEWIVKATDATGSKYSMAMVTAVTDGTSADYSQFGGVNLGGTTGTLSVSVVGSNVELQVTPASSNSTTWVTQYRTI